MSRNLPTSNKWPDLYLLTTRRSEAIFIYKSHINERHTKVIELKKTFHTTKYKGYNCGTNSIMTFNNCVIAFSRIQDSVASPRVKFEIGIQFSTNNVFNIYIVRRFTLEIGH